MDKANMLAAVAVIAAAPAWADTAQDAAAAEIAALSYSIPELRDLRQIPVWPIILVDQFELSGCMMTISRYFPAIGPESFIRRLTLDLAQDHFQWVVLDRESGAMGLPFGWQASVLTFSAAAGSELQMQSRDENRLAITLNNLDEPVDPREVLGLLDAFTSEVPQNGAMTAGEVAYYDPPDTDRIETLKTTLDAYVADWCRPED